MVLLKFETGGADRELDLLSDNPIKIIRKEHQEEDDGAGPYDLHITVTHEGVILDAVDQGGVVVATSADTFDNMLYPTSGGKSEAEFEMLSDPPRFRVQGCQTGRHTSKYPGTPLVGSPQHLREAAKQVIKDLQYALEEHDEEKKHEESDSNSSSA